MVLGRRRLSASEHLVRLREFGGWFFGDAKFMSVPEFLDWLSRSAPRHVALVPEVIAREQRRDLALDSTDSVGRAATVWREIQDSDLTVFKFSPGGDLLTVIAWSARDQRFYELLECC